MYTNADYRAVQVQRIAATRTLIATRQAVVAAAAVSILMI